MFRSVVQYIHNMVYIHICKHTFKWHQFFRCRQLNDNGPVSEIVFSINISCWIKISRGISPRCCFSACTCNGIRLDRDTHSSFLLLFSVRHSWYCRFDDMFMFSIRMNEMRKNPPNYHDSTDIVWTTIHTVT